jgi:uncharacterized YigZ family protein
MVDSFQSIVAPSTGLFTDRGSKFLAFAWPVSNEDQIKEYQDTLRKEHFKARHHCYAWRLGTDGNQFRANDDGEPSGTGGKPILGQIDSHQLTDVLVVVVRYFGGTLLGTSGLIQAYKAAAHEALAQAQVVTHFLHVSFRINMPYTLLPKFTELARKTEAQITEEDWLEQHCSLVLGVRLSHQDLVLDKIKAGLYDLPASESAGLDWPVGFSIELL